MNSYRCKRIEISPSEFAVMEPFSNSLVIYIPPVECVIFPGSYDLLVRFNDK